MATLNKIVPMASSHTVTVSVDKVELQAKFDQYWDTVKDALPADLVKASKKGGYRKVTRDRVVVAAGGVSRFYEPVLMAIIEDVMNTQERQTLVVGRCDLIDTHGELVVTGIIYLEPTVTWKKKPGIDEPLFVAEPEDRPEMVDELMAAELERKQHESSILVPLLDGQPVADGNVVVLHCNSALVGDDGKLVKWEDGTFTNQKWSVTTDFIRQRELYDAIVGMVPPENKTVELVVGTYSPFAGKKVRASITVQQAFAKTTPKIDDDLAKTFGFDSLDIMKQSLRLNFTKKAVESKETFRINSIMSSLLTPDVVDVSPVPLDWMIHKGRTLYNEGRGYTKTDEELISRFAGAVCVDGTKVIDKATLIHFMAERAAQNLIADLVLRSWGKMKGVPGDTTLKNIAAYVQDVKAELSKVAQVK